MNTESKRKVSKLDNLKVLRENRIANPSGGTQSCNTFPKRGTASTQKEIIAQFFDSMIESIVCCWIIADDENDEKESKNSETHSDKSIAHSATTSSTNIKTIIAKPLIQIKSQSKIDLSSQITESQHTSILSLSSLKGSIHFLNGNLYEGDLFKNRMHGDGCFQWADGTKYRGQFKDNRITGTGLIEFKDNTWYEGEFLNNVRHGEGLYVDSGRQRSYFGHWSSGAKHGQGVMYYMSTNSYDGEWRDNRRHGSGLRRYCPNSGYDGHWNNDIRQGNGLMIWPNSDMYDGEWNNGLMCGNGKYIWSSFNNDSMSLPALCVYRGNWENGLRNGQGVIDFGFGMGSCYRGQFKNNRKDGAGQLVTNNGLILQDILFIDDNISALNKDNETTHDNTTKNKMVLEFFNELDIEYHIRETFQTRIELRDNKIIKDYLEANYNITKGKINDTVNNDAVTDFDDLMEFEISSLRKSLLYYQTQLKRIYNVYATVCNKEEINFEPVLIRLYLWQMYYDCRIHHKRLTLYEIDNLMSRNENWQAKLPHDPFEEIYYWQFLHSLISVATYIYAKKYITNRKPNTVLASAFKQFIDDDVLPRVGDKRGKLANGYGRVIPLKNLYILYLGLDNPCTIQSIICRIHKEGLTTGTSSTYYNRKLFRGNNTCIYDDQVSFMFDNIHPYVLDLNIGPQGWDLSNLSNVPPKTIIKIFSKIFPEITEERKIMILEEELTFFEFFEAFVTLAEESVKLEEIANFSLVQ